MEVNDRDRTKWKKVFSQQVSGDLHVICFFILQDEQRRPNYWPCLLSLQVTDRGGNEITREMKRNSTLINKYSKTQQPLGSTGCSHLL